MQSTEDQDLAHSRLQPGDRACGTVGAPGQTRALSRFCVPGGMAWRPRIQGRCGHGPRPDGATGIPGNLPLIPDQCVSGTTVGIQ